MSVNKVILVGNLGRDPEAFSAGCRLNVATTYKDATEWHRVTVFSPIAERCVKYLHKGSSLYLEGRLETRSYEKDGVKKYSTDIIASDVRFLGGRGEGRQGETTNGADGAKSTPPSDDEIPF